MSQSKTTRRGKRSPTSVWIESYKGRRGKSYRLRWIDPQTDQRQAEPCGRDYALARDKRIDKKVELRDGLSARLPDKALSDLIAQVDTFMAGKAPATRRKTKASLRKLIDLCQDRRLHHVDRGMMMDFRARRIDSGVAIPTVNKDLRQIKSALSYAVDARWLKVNPLWRWKAMQLREPDKRIRVIEPAEFTKLLEKCEDPTLRVLLLVAYRQGLRRTELANLRWAAVDLGKGVLYAENVAEAGEFTKSRKVRAVYLVEEVKAELTAIRDAASKVLKKGQYRPKHPHVFTWPDGQPFKPDWLTRWFTALVEKVDIPPCTLHDLRRSWSTLAQRAGVDRATVKDMGGWSTIAVVEKHYTGEVPEAFKRATKKIEAGQKAG